MSSLFVAGFSSLFAVVVSLGAFSSLSWYFGAVIVSQAQMCLNMPWAQTLLLLLFALFCDAIIVGQQNELNLRTTAMSSVSSFKSPPVACNDYCAGLGYPPNSGQQHGIPPACGDNSCASTGCQNPDHDLYPVCVDNFDPACFGRGASCCCGIGYSYVNRWDGNWTMFALCPLLRANGHKNNNNDDNEEEEASEFTGFKCFNLESAVDHLDDNPPTFECRHPSNYDSFFGFLPDDTCMLDGAKTFPSPIFPEPSYGPTWCNIQSFHDCKLACQQTSPYGLLNVDVGVFAYFSEPDDVCECYVPTGFTGSEASFSYSTHSTYGCTTTTSTTPNATTTTTAAPMSTTTTTTPRQVLPQETLEIVLGISGGVLAIVVVVTIVCCCRKNKEKQQDTHNLKEPFYLSEED